MDANDVPFEPLVLSIRLIIALWSHRVGFPADTRPEREPHALLRPFVFIFVSIRVHSRLNSLSASIRVYLRLVFSGSRCYLGKSRKHLRPARDAEDQHTGKHTERTAGDEGRVVGATHGT
jgi:hypothetical protein